MAKVSSATIPALIVGRRWQWWIWKRCGGHRCRAYNTIPAHSLLQYWAKCWGYNGEGELGDNSSANRWTPVAVVDLGGGSVVILTRTSITTSLLPMQVKLRPSTEVARGPAGFAPEVVSSRAAARPFAGSTAASRPAPTHIFIRLIPSSVPTSSSCRLLPQRLKNVGISRVSILSRHYRPGDNAQPGRSRSIGPITMGLPAASTAITELALTKQPSHR